MTRGNYLTDRRVLGYMLGLLRKGGIEVGGIVAADWLSRIQLIITPLLWKWVLDNLQRDGNPAELAKAAALYLLAGAVLLVFGLIHSALSSRVGERVGRELRERLFDRLESTRPEDQAKEESGALLASFTNDLPAVESMMGGSAPGFLASALNCALMVSFLAWLYLPFLGLCVVLSVLPVGAAVVSNRRMRRAGGKVQAANERVVVTLSDLVEGRRELMLLGGLRRIFYPIFAKSYVDRYDAALRLAMRTTAFRGIANFAFLGAMVAIFFLAFVFVIQGRITLGTAVAILEFYLGLGYEGRNLYTHNQGIQLGLVSLGRIMERLADIPGESASAAAARPATVEPKAATWVARAVSPRESRENAGDDGEAIRFEHVHFQYNGGPEILTDLNLVLRRKEIMVILGASGAGKTTLAMLAAGIYQPTSGRVCLTDEGIAPVTHGFGRTGVLQQSPHLFTGSIRENFRLVCPGASEAAMIEALEAAGLREFVAGLPGGLEAGVGARGHALSAGQQQRLALARLFLRDPDYWILDEPTASLDSETEDHVVAVLRERLRGKAALMVTHSHAVVGLADRIYELKAGRLHSVAVGAANREPAGNQRAIR